jgi:Protein of unknown function (DUF2635)
MQMLVRPATGLRVLCPDGQPLPAEGASVTADSFWHRRLAKGEVELVPAGGTTGGEPPARGKE